MKCRGFQYKNGEKYREENANLCHSGFHACENPLDTFSYYVPGNGSRYCEVELGEVSEQKDSDTKRCGKVIKIGAELSVAGICKAHFEYVTARCNPAKSNAAGDRESAAAGYKGSAAAGSWGSAAAGSWGSAAAGSWGSAAAGYKGSAAAGESGSAAAGSWGSAAAGQNGLACCRGGKVKGGLGCAICCTELDMYGNNVGIVAALVDGEKIKADTWYIAKNGEFVEVAGSDG